MASRFASRNLALIWISFNALLPIVTCLSCLDCKSLKEGMTNQGSTNEAKCLAARLYEKCLEDVPQCEEKDGLLQEVHSVIQHMEFNNYICESEPLVLKRRSAKKKKIQSVAGDDKKESNSTEVEKGKTKSGYVPGITGLWITLGIWGGTVCITIAISLIVYSRHRSHQQKKKRKQRRDAELESSAQVSDVFTY